MRTGKVHQLLHGYSNGHRKLAGSLKLSSSDAELVNRISDLSGPLFGSRDFRPYFTGYPLPSREYYAVARTWIDSEAPRAGSVLTHTLLISTKEFGEIEDLQVIFELLEEKPARDELWYYKEPLSLFPQDFLKPEIANLNETVVIDFIDKYFGEGLRPILWLDAPSPRDIVRLVMRGLWPRMRHHFAFCTLSLQLRNLDDRSFDMLFAPSSRLNKHHQLERANIVGIQPGAPLRMTMELQAREWQTEFAKAIFSDRSELSQFQDKFAELWRHLGPDPTVVSRLYRLAELEKRVSSSPTAVVGVMDLVGSLVPEQDQAISYKTRIASEGIEANRPFLDLHQSLKSLYLISDRLMHTAFERLDDTVSWRLADVVSVATSEAPSVAIETGKQILLSEKASKSPYVVGVAQGLAKMAKSSPDNLLHLTPPVVSIPVLIALQPAIAVTYFDLTRNLAKAEEASRELVRGLRYVEDKRERRQIREALLPKVAMYGDITILKELLSDLPPEEVAISLDCMEGATDGFSLDTVRQAVAVEISEKHPDVVKEWGCKTTRWTFGVATVVAATFARKPLGLEEVLSYSGSEPQQSILLAAFIDSQGKYKIPEWLQDRLRSDPEVFMKLLVDGVQNVPEMCIVIERVLSEVPDIPLVVDASLLNAVERFREATFGEELIDAAMARVVAGYVDGSIRDREYDQWISSAHGKAWFDTISHHRLSSLIVRREETAVPRWAQTWGTIQRAPDTLYARRPHIIDDLIGRLLSACPDKWPDDVSHKWVSIIQRAEDAGTKWLHLALCEQALSYSFKHLELPLSKLVVVSFPIVYKYTVGSSSTSGFSYLFRQFLDWDKGKELRRQIVRSFLSSKWPPEDLALAMPDQQTLRKIFKRLRRYSGGDGFISEMLAGLDNCGDSKAPKMYRALKEMVESPDFYESWD